MDSNFADPFDHTQLFLPNEQYLDTLVSESSNSGMTGLADLSPTYFVLTTQDEEKEREIQNEEESDSTDGTDRSAQDVPDASMEGKTKITQSSRICRICGDKALGYNFNVVTCESCKAFFRRNALKKKDFRCPSRGKCKITVSSRRYCQKCRLQKCFEAGMRPEYIMTDEQLVEKRKKLIAKMAMQSSRSERDRNELNYEVSLDDNESRMDQTSQSTTGLSPSNTPGAGGNSRANNIQFSWDRIHSDALQCACKSTEGRSVRNNDGQRDTVDITVSIPKSELFSMLFNNDENDEQALALGKLLISSMKMSARRMTSGGDQKTVDGDRVRVDERRLALSPIGTSPCPSYSASGQGEYCTAWNSVSSTDAHAELIDCMVSSMGDDWDTPVLSPHSLYIDLKYAKLDELIDASQEWYTIPQGFPLIRSGKANEFGPQDYSNLLCFGTICAVKQHSRLSAFKQLPIHDQYALLHPAVMQICLLGAAMRYDPDTDLMFLRCPGQEYVDLNISKNVFGDVYNQTKELFSSYPKQWRRDERLILILDALALFNPNRASLENRQTVDAERQVYIQLLRDYLKHTYSEEEAVYGEPYLLELSEKIARWVDLFKNTIIYHFDPCTADVTYFHITEL